MIHSLLDSEAFRQELRQLLADTQQIDWAEVCERLSLSRSSVERLIAQGKFFEPRKFNRRALWSSGRVAAWLRLDCPVVARFDEIERSLYSD